MTKLEQLPNELILLCFAYLGFYNIYQILFHLNKRFNELVGQDIKTRIVLSSIPSRKFLTFFFQLQELIKSDQNYPLSILADNKDKLKLILQDDFFIKTSSKLKSLTLSNMDCKTIYSMIFDYPTKLCERLERLILLNDITEEYHENLEKLCNNLISSKMKSLKYLKLNFKPYWYRCCECGLHTRGYCIYLDFDRCIIEEELLSSNLETLIIGDGNSCTLLCFNALTKRLLPYLPKLRTLQIDSIYFDQDSRPARQQNLPSMTEMNSNISLNLKFIKIKINRSGLSQNDMTTMERFLRNFFLNNRSAHAMTIERFYINNKNVL